MNEPRRIVDEAPDDLGAVLVRAARQERPSSSSRRRTLASLGLAAATTAAAAKVGTGVLGSKPLGTVPLALLAKWIGIGIMAGGVAVGASTLLRSRSSWNDAAPAHSAGPALRLATSAPKPAATAHAETPAESASAPSPAVHLAPRPTATYRTASSGSEPAPSASSSTAVPSDLAAELALVEGARAALRSGRANEALVLLDTRDRDHPHGVLGVESAALRIEALAETGDRARAAELGRAFLDAHPNSPLAQRVRVSIGESSPPEGSE